MLLAAGAADVKWKPGANLNLGDIRREFILLLLETGLSAGHIGITIANFEKKPTPLGGGNSGAERNESLGLDAVAVFTKSESDCPERSNEVWNSDPALNTDIWRYAALVGERAGARLAGKGLRRAELVPGFHQRGSHVRPAEG